MKTFKRIIEEYTKTGKTISTMESCTGGGIVNAITNIEGSSDIIRFSAVTYSNEYKIKMGVPKEVIENYSVYSMETADAMAKAISDYTKSNIGIGITGKFNRKDKNNPYGENNIVFISIYDDDIDAYMRSTIKIAKSSRESNKELVIEEIINMLEKDAK